MPYVAKERIFVNDANQPCDENDPRVAVMLVRPGGQLASADVERFGLAQDKRLIRIPDPNEDPVAERGSTYYETTGQEPPTPAHATRILGETPQDRTAPAPAGRAPSEPAKSTGSAIEPKKG